MSLTRGDLETMADDAADEIARLTTKVVRLTNELAELRQAVWDACIALGFDSDGDATPGALVSPPLGELLLEVVGDAMGWH
jgi:hypothetical protein